jgi:hypothetical protein
MSLRLTYYRAVLAAWKEPCKDFTLPSEDNPTPLWVVVISVIFSVLGFCVLCLYPCGYLWWHWEEIWYKFHHQFLEKNDDKIVNNRNSKKCQSEANGPVMQNMTPSATLATNWRAPQPAEFEACQPPPHTSSYGNRSTVSGAGIPYDQTSSAAMAHQSSIELTLMLRNAHSAAGNSGTTITASLHQTHTVPVSSNPVLVSSPQQPQQLTSQSASQAHMVSPGLQRSIQLPIYAKNQITNHHNHYGFSSDQPVPTSVSISVHQPYPKQQHTQQPHRIVVEAVPVNNVPKDATPIAPAK